MQKKVRRLGGMRGVPVGRQRRCLRTREARGDLARLQRRDIEADSPAK